MGQAMTEDPLKAFERPDEAREFPFGRFEIVHIAGVTLGRATYQPGWRWSVHNAPSVGTKLCHAPHTGVVLSGHGAVQYEDGRYLDLLPGTVFHISTAPHDSWVVGDAPYVSLHVLKPPA
jgi:quercetin dioxygenase-like cupin family protein